jgi:hypothetical protein
MGISAIALLALAASGATLGVQYGGVINRDIRLITASYLMAGAAGRVLIEANCSEKWRENIQVLSSRWYFEMFEAFWQAFLNVSSQASQSAVLNALMVFGSFGFVGDFLFPFRSVKKESPQELLENPLVHEDEEVDHEDEKAVAVNPIIGPAYNNLRGQIVLKTALAGLGALLIGGSYVKNTGLNAFYRSLGYFLSAQWVGFFAANIGSRWLPFEENLDAQPRENLVDSTLPASLKTRIRRFAPKIATNVGPELLALVYWWDDPKLYVLAGAVYGFMQFLAQKKFQDLTKDVYGKQVSRNVEGNKIKTALKVEMAASVGFLALFLGWFTYGAEQSQPKDRRPLIVLMISYVLTELCAVPLEKYFKPQQKGMLVRIINHLRYVFYHHPYSIALAYLSLKQITEINDEALMLDSTPEYICGLAATALFGINFALNRMRNICGSAHVVCQHSY